jgi:glucokinase
MRTDRYLVADIGATNVRAAVATQAGISGAPIRVPTAGWSDSETLLLAMRERLGLAAPTACCLAVAGPVSGNAGRITNGHLAFDGAALSRALGCRVTVVNDFHALARALPQLADLRQIGGGEPAPGVKAVLGPGTGLGMGALVPVNGGWMVLASEGGHADLAPGTPLETEILQILHFELGHVSWETVLSGPGLVRLYRAVCRVWGTEPDELTAEQVTAAGVQADQPVCHQTLEIFFGLLGTAAGNLAVTLYALGGVYVGGGIVPRLVDFPSQPPFRRRFEERGPVFDLARAIPSYVIMDRDPGLLGALECLRAEPDLQS